MLPIGGGGLAAGIAIALRALRPGRRGSSACRRGRPASGTIADGIAVKHPGELTMSILDELLDDIVHVEDEQIAEAITLLLERVEARRRGRRRGVGRGAAHGQVGGAAMCARSSPAGNIDPTLLISVIRHGLHAPGRYLVLRTRVPDRPGELVKLLELVADERGNVVSVEHHREGWRSTSPRPRSS